MRGVSMDGMNGTMIMTEGWDGNSKSGSIIIMGRLLYFFFLHLVIIDRIEV